jgi:hypothetical protein
VGRISTGEYLEEGVGTLSLDDAKIADGVKIDNCMGCELNVLSRTNILSDVRLNPTVSSRVDIKGASTLQGNMSIFGYKGSVVNVEDSIVLGNIEIDSISGTSEIRLGKGSLMKGNITFKSPNSGAVILGEGSKFEGKVVNGAKIRSGIQSSISLA